LPSNGIQVHLDIRSFSNGQEAKRIIVLDKNPHRLEEAEERFKRIQQAYEVLSDPQERSWYDAHREAILQGGDGSNDESHSINLWPYFRSSCYKGYKDDPEVSLSLTER
jgi:curved DNA-binding protein CbpA